MLLLLVQKQPKGSLHIVTAPSDVETFIVVLLRVPITCGNRRVLITFYRSMENVSFSLFLQDAMSAVIGVEEFVIHRMIWVGFVRERRSIDKMNSFMEISFDMVLSPIWKWRLSNRQRVDFSVK